MNDSALAKDRSNPGRPRVLDTILFGGLTAALGDFLFAVIFYGFILGARQLRIWQSVAAGVLGRAAFDGGLATYSLGILLHFVNGICIAAVFYLVTSRFTVLLTRPVVTGLLYGMIVYLGMNYTVIPLSGASSGQFSISPYFFIEIIGHAFLVGLPIALIAWRSAAKPHKTSYTDALFREHSS